MQCLAKLQRPLLGYVCLTLTMGRRIERLTIVWLEFLESQKCIQSFAKGRLLSLKLSVLSVCCVYHCAVLDWVGRLLLLNTAPIFMYSSFIALTGTLGRIVYTSKALSNMVHALSFANSFSSR